MIIQTKVIGINIFQPNLIIWSYLYLGNVALNHKKLNIKIDDFNISHIVPGIIAKYDPIKLLGEIGDNHPPKNERGGPKTGPPFKSKSSTPIPISD